MTMTPTFVRLSMNAARTLPASGMVSSVPGCPNDRSNLLTSFSVSVSAGSAGGGVGIVGVVVDVAGGVFIGQLGR
jgi:hypothetical protein